MKKWITELDRLLRGQLTGLSNLREGRIEFSVKGLFVLIILLSAVYGACMGGYALFREESRSALQFLSTMVKVPALFLLTLIVTFPSLYVFNALVGSRLNSGSVLRLLIAALGVNLAVLASLGPIVAFFSVSTTNYHFMVLLNVAMFAVAGFLGLVFLLRTLHRLSLSLAEQAPASTLPSASKVPEAAGAGSAPPQIPPPGQGALDREEGYVLGPHVKWVFRCWIVVFALVGSQMGWVLRPFLGDPTRPFSLFRARGSSFIESVWHHLISLFG